MRSTFCGHAELTKPWALEMPAIPDTVSFHVVTSGLCFLQLPEVEPMELRAGDLALVPHGLGHELRSGGIAAPSRRVDLLPQRYVSEHYSVLQHGGDGAASQLICGVVSFDEPAAGELIRSLPACMFVSGSRTSAASSIRDTLRLMAEELSRPQPGGETVATRLADILVVQAVRSWIETDADLSRGWLYALQDEQIGRAIEAIHQDPGAPWTLDRLARVAATSRLSFSTRFTDLAGESPIAYLTRWRMRLARSRLLNEDTTASRLAAELGYRSEAAFNRAFTRIMGQTPGAVRRTGR